ncbi:unnamed protein product [Coffea canephora]|uniref:Alcohol dehydrogenase-like N-terminal domain-containing protein n=1 Tax=Coffea canephora TaxID=49390 RepID=A0A068UVD0_COFCA|nr:unnamed protein product [Coffea canephora]
MGTSTPVNIPSKMKAWVYGQYGKPEDVLKLKSEVDVPDVNDDQVLIKVVAASLNPINFKHMHGYFKAIDSPPPVNTFFLFFSRKIVVYRVGSKVKEFEVGDEAYGDIHEHICFVPKGMWVTSGVHCSGGEGTSFEAQEFEFCKGNKPSCSCRNSVWGPSKRWAFSW